MASTRSRSASESGSNFCALCRLPSYPAMVRVFAARASIASPRCQVPVPELVTWTRSASPASSIRAARTTSATGERQMLPRQTTAMR